MLEDYCVIDLEMTGLNPKHHKILEVAAVRVRKKEIVIVPEAAHPAGFSEEEEKLEKVCAVAVAPPARD